MADLTRQFTNIPPTRPWGVALPGHSYPQVEGPGNPFWERRHPELNPILNKNQIVRDTINPITEPKVGMPTINSNPGGMGFWTRQPDGSYVGGDSFSGQTRRAPTDGLLDKNQIVRDAINPITEPIVGMPNTYTRPSKPIIDDWGFRPRPVPTGKNQIARDAINPITEPKVGMPDKVGVPKINVTSLNKPDYTYSGLSPEELQRLRNAKQMAIDASVYKK
jgi:hypothetical protein